MLVLSRRLGESLKIGDDITITVLGVSRNQARIGIGAPQEIPVHREEVYRRLQSQAISQRPDLASNDKEQR